MAQALALALTGWKRAGKKETPAEVDATANAANPKMIRRALSIVPAVVVVGAVLTAVLRSENQPMTPALQSRDAADAAAAQLHPASWPDDSLTMANLGHATMLMNFFGVQVISDPALFYRVGLAFDSVFTIGPHRLTALPLKPAQLPRLDVILITHAHMDHLDLPSLEALPKSAVVIACAGCASLIRPLGYGDVRELTWGQQTEVDGLKVTAMGARHWGRRWPWGRDYGYNSYLLEKNGRRMLLACDSAATDLFVVLHHRPLEVAAFSIGAYDPYIRHHANPEQVWRMFQQTGADYLVPIHWGTFRLSREPIGEPMERLVQAAGPDAWRIVMRRIGAAWTLPQGALAHVVRPSS